MIKKQEEIKKMIEDHEMELSELQKRFKGDESKYKRYFFIFILCVVYLLGVWFTKNMIFSICAGGVIIVFVYLTSDGFKKQKQLKKELKDLEESYDEGGIDNEEI